MVSKSFDWPYLNALCMQGTAEELRRYISEHDITARALNETHYYCEPPSLFGRPMSLPLGAAIQAENLGTIRVLLEMGASPDGNQCGFTPLQEAIDHPAVLPLLVPDSFWWHTEKHAAESSESWPTRWPLRRPSPLGEVDFEALCQHEGSVLSSRLRKHRKWLVVQYVGSDSHRPVVSDEAIALLYPNATPEQRSRWRQRLHLAQSGDAWCLGTAPFKMAECVASRLSPVWQEFGFNLLVVKSHRWSENLSNSLLETNIHQRCHRILFGELMRGAQLYTPDILLGKEFQSLPKDYQALICRMAIPEDLLADFQQLLKDEAPPELLNCLAASRQPCTEKHRQCLDSLLYSTSLFSQSKLADLIQDILPSPYDRAILIDALRQMPFQPEQRDETNALVAAFFTLLSPKDR